MARTIRRLAFALLLAVLAFVGGRAIYRALASPETKIRWRLEQMVEGFNAMRAQPVLDGIARDFIDRSAGISRDDIHSTLVWLYLNELDSKGEFLWKAVFDPLEMKLEVAPDKRSAAVECHVQFFRREGQGTKLDWDARIAGTFTRGADGWQWSTVSSANHAARHLR